MMKWKMGVAVVMLSGVLAACGGNDAEDNANNDANNGNTQVDEQGTRDHGTSNNGNGANNGNGSADLDMNGENGSVDSGNNGATTNGGNNMNGAGGNHGESGNNDANRNGGAGAGTEEDDRNMLDDAASDVERGADRIVDEGENLVDDATDGMRAR